MSRKIHLPIIFVVLFTMLLGACAPSPEQAPTTEPVIEQPGVEGLVEVEEPTDEIMAEELIVVETLDFQSILAEVIAKNGKNAGYGLLVPHDFIIELIEDPDLFVIDVREPSELEDNGHIPGAVNIPIKTLADNPALLPADLDTPIVVYCKNGIRSTWAWMILSALGYNNVRNMASGMDGWLAADFGTDEGLAPAEEINTAIIKDETRYLAVKDFANNAPEDWANVKPTDVNKMFINGEEFILIDVRRPDEYAGGYIDQAINIPLEEIANRMGELDPNAEIIVYCKSGTRGLISALTLRLNGYENVLNISGGYLGWQSAGLPVAATADFKIIYAGIIANNGQDKGYSFIAPDALNTELIENPDLFVIDVREPSELEENGHIPGAVNIPVKTLADNPALLPADLDTPIVVYCKSGTRSTYAWNILQMLGYTNVRNMNAGMDGWLGAQLGADEGLAPAEEISTAIIADEARYMAVKNFANNPPEGWATITNVDVQEKMINGDEFVLLDVRRPDEYAGGYIDQAINFPLEEIANRMSELDPNAEIIVYCKSGGRGLTATIALLMNGFTNVHNMAGGVLGWEAAELPLVTP